MFGDQALFGDLGGRGRRGEGLGGDLLRNFVLLTGQYIPELRMRLDSGFQGLDSGVQSPGFLIPKATKC